MRATSARGRVPERALWRETIDLAIRTAEATAFVVHGRKIAAAVVHHLAWVIHSLTNSAGIAHASDEDLARHAHRDAKTVSRCQRSSKTPRPGADKFLTLIDLIGSGTRFSVDHQTVEPPERLQFYQAHLKARNREESGSPVSQRRIEAGGGSVRGLSGVADRLDCRIGRGSRSPTTAAARCVDTGTAVATRPRVWRHPRTCVILPLHPTPRSRST